MYVCVCAAGASVRATAVLYTTSYYCDCFFYTQHRTASAVPQCLSSLLFLHITLYILSFSSISISYCFPLSFFPPPFSNFHFFFFLLLFVSLSLLVSPEIVRSSDTAHKKSTVEEEELFYLFPFRSLPKYKYICIYIKERKK